MSIWLSDQKSWEMLPMGVLLGSSMGKALHQGLQVGSRMGYAPHHKLEWEHVPCPQCKDQSKCGRQARAQVLEGPRTLTPSPPGSSGAFLGICTSVCSRKAESAICQGREAHSQSVQPRAKEQASRAQMEVAAWSPWLRAPELGGRHRARGGASEP